MKTGSAISGTRLHKRLYDLLRNDRLATRRDAIAGLGRFFLTAVWAAISLRLTGRGEVVAHYRRSFLRKIVSSFEIVAEKVDLPIYILLQ